MELENKKKIYELLEKQEEFKREYDNLNAREGGNILQLKMFTEERPRNIAYINLTYLPTETKQQIKDDILGRISLEIKSIDEQLKEL